jgi:NADH-quinone oxidoreductase subunit N
MNSSIFWQTQPNSPIQLDKLWQIEWSALLPAWVATGAILLTLLADLVLPKTQRHLISWVAFAGLLLAGVSSFLTPTGRPVVETDRYFFQNMVASDDLSRILALIIFGAATLVVLASPDYLARMGVIQTGEYYALVIAAAMGMWLITATTHFMVFFVALELFSLALYILAGFLPRSVRSHEAGFKYFILSSFASGLMLYGIALLFGAAGSTSYQVIGDYVRSNGVSGANGVFVLLGLGLVAVGFAFKISAIPFHQWTPDVYEGSPTPVTALMAVGTKAAIVAAFLRVFAGVLGPIGDIWKPILAVLAVVTMIGGNLLAISQPGVKRMLAYSSVAHAGYLLVGIVADNDLGRTGVIFYLVAYTLMTLGAFLVVIAIEGPQGEGLLVSDFAGLRQDHPWLAAVMAVCLLSLGGIPPMAGFFGKALVFGAAIQEGGWYLILPIVGVLTSVLAVFYYFRLVVQMYMGVPPAGKPAHRAGGRQARTLSFSLGVAALGTIVLGILTNFALQWIDSAAAVIGQVAR